MNLCAAGHEVFLCDSYLRRRLNKKFDSEPLIDVPPLEERAQAWKRANGRTLHVSIGDLTDWKFALEFFNRARPLAIVHYAEVPSAPLSMADHECSSLVLHNNLGTTHNVIHAVREICPDAHIIKLGTMGEYGTPNIDIEEGWLEIEHKGRHERFLFPREGGSLYHTTKVMDTDLLYFYVKTWNLRVTDLMQGPVYGIATADASANPALMPHFSYDAIFGTVLNRFIVQAVAGVPLMVYGAGTQKRGFINIRDTLQCIRLAVDNPAERGALRIFNQFTEVFSIVELARRVVAACGALGLKAEIEHLPNPRVEKEEHYYNPAHSSFRALGLEPHFLDQNEIIGMIETVRSFSHRIDTRHLYPTVRWRPDDLRDDSRESAAGSDSASYRNRFSDCCGPAQPS